MAIQPGKTVHSPLLKLGSLLYFFNDVLPEEMHHAHVSRQRLSIIWDCTVRSVCRAKSLLRGRFEAAFHAMAFKVSDGVMAYLIHTWLLEVEMLTCVYTCRVTFLAIFALMWLRERHEGLTVALCVWAAVTAISRCLMGRHYLGDVLVGAVTGLATAATLSKVASELSALPSFTASCKDIARQPWWLHRLQCVCCKGPGRDMWHLLSLVQGILPWSGRS